MGTSMDGNEQRWGQSAREDEKETRSYYDEKKINS